MEHEKSGQKDISSGEEPDPKRHKGDPSKANGKSVVILLDSDVTKNGQFVSMPNTIEMAQIKKKDKGRFKTNINFTREMTETVVHHVLLENFPFLRNKRRIRCGSAYDGRSKLNFNGNPRLWDGQHIRRLIKGNSTLYLLVEDQNHEIQSSVIPDHRSVSQMIHTPTDFLQTNNMTSPWPLKQDMFTGKTTTQWESFSTQSMLRVPYSEKQGIGTITCTPVTQADTSHITGQQPVLQFVRPAIPSKAPTEESRLQSVNSVASQPSLNQVPLTTLVQPQQADLRVLVATQSLKELSQTSSTTNQGYVTEKLLLDLVGGESSDSGIHSMLEGQNSDYDTEAGLPEDIEPVTISPRKGSTKGGDRFHLILRDCIPLEVVSCVAVFEGCGEVLLDLVNPFTLTGKTPSSNSPGLVKVKLRSFDGSWSCDETEFQYEDLFTKDESLIQLVKDPEMQRKFFGLMHKGISNSQDQQTSDPSNDTGQGSSGMNQYTKSVKLLQLLVYKAAEIDGREIIQVVFSTSTGKVLFNNYKNNAVLPEDVARANGHTALADYLHNVTNRLSKESDGDDRIESIDWLELKHAVEKEHSLPCIEETQTSMNCQPLKCLESDDNESDYFADDEISICSSPSRSEVFDTEVEDEGQNTQDIWTEMQGVDKKMSMTTTTSVRQLHSDTRSIAEEEEVMNYNVPFVDEMHIPWDLNDGDHIPMQETNNRTAYDTSPAKKAKDTKECGAQLCRDSPPLQGPLEIPKTELVLVVDVLLLAVEDFEFLACYYNLNIPFMGYYCRDIGPVYFGSMGNDSNKTLKIALMKCCKDSTVPCGSLTRVQSAVRVLRPKAVFSVGACSGLNQAKVKLGDVVVSSKLRTLTSKIYASRPIGTLIRHAVDGWKASSENPDSWVVNVHHDGEILIGQETISEELFQQCPEAIAVIEDEGVFAVAQDLKIDWVVVKGIKDFADSSQSSGDEWEGCASIMAASVVADMLSDAIEFEDWSHYSQDISSEEETSNSHASKRELLELVDPLNAELSSLSEYAVEQLNYFRICYITTDVLTEGLRSIFKQEWDNRYKATLGEWKDEPRNGMDFYNGESPRNKKRNAHLLATMKNGNRAEWDCTMLFYAILFSDGIHGLNPVVQSSVDDLRKFQNEEFAHMPKGHLADPEFLIAINKVQTAFHALGLSTLQIQEIINQTSFPTEELRNVLKKVDDLKQELQEKEKEIEEKLNELKKKLEEKGKELEEKGNQVEEKEEERQVPEDQLQNEISSFCILPPKPSHDIASRDCEVAEITQRLKQLKSSNESILSCLYLSGNPGSGKTQLASLIAKRFYDEVQEIPWATSFVMTVDAKSPQTLLESYVSFSRHLKCPEYAISNIFTSKDLSTDEKIHYLKTLISTKIQYYPAWLLIVDNVTSTSDVYAHLPEPGSEQWARGQLLITTQDTQSIPLTSAFIKHISVSKGMEPHDASSLLAKLSGVTDRDMENEVAQALNFQPLALASAGYYVWLVRETNETCSFGWKDYLKKLEESQRGTTETSLLEENPSYQKTMTTVVTQAVKKVITSDKIMKHTFSLLSLCRLQSLSLDIVVNYILSMDEEIVEKDTVGTRIQGCFLLLFEEDESGIYIQEHQVVHDVINTVESGHVDLVDVATMFNTLGSVCKDLGNLEQAKEHLDRGLAIRLKKLGPEHVNVATSYHNLACVCRDLGDLEQAKEYHDRALVIRLKKLGPEHVNVATSYHNLASVYRDLGDLKQAKECHDRALVIRLKKLGPEHVDVAESYNNLASVCRDLGDLGQAKEYHERALHIKLKRLGPENVDVATSYNNLACVYNDLRDLEQAKEYQERSLAIQLKKLGPEHVNVATSYKNLALVYRNLGDLEQAKEYHHRALAIRLKKFGPEHVAVAHSYNNLAAVHRDVGDLEQAKEYHDRELAILPIKLVPERENFLTSYHSHCQDEAHIHLSGWSRLKGYHNRAAACQTLSKSSYTCTKHFPKKKAPEESGTARLMSQLTNTKKTVTVRQFFKALEFAQLR